MDKILEQLGSGGLQNLQGLFGGAGGDSEEGSSQEEDATLEARALMDNAKLIYDIFIQNSLRSTSHSIQWLKHYEEDQDYSNFVWMHFLFGTHYNGPEVPQGQGEQDYMYIAKVRVPKYDKEVKSTIDCSKLKSDHSELKIVKEFLHGGDVSKARAMPQNETIIASMMDDGVIAIYDEEDLPTSQNCPTGLLMGLTQGGFGLSWSYGWQGLIAGAAGNDIALFDINKGYQENSGQIIKDAHSDIINDLKFSSVNHNLFGTASDDGTFKLWDMRIIQRQLENIVETKASDDENLVISFNHFNEYLFATGGESTGNIYVWDLRMPKNFINDLVYHKDFVSQIEWSPHSENLFMSASKDGKVFVWDHGKTGEEQARHDFQDGPPELIFPHELHQKTNVEDIAWCPVIEGNPNFGNRLLVASVDTDTRMQIWKMTEDFFFNDIDFNDDLDQIKEGDVE